MGCGCTDPCPEFEFGCGWCGTGVFTCLRYNRLGECIKFDGAVPDPETCDAEDCALPEVLTMPYDGYTCEGTGYEACLQACSDTFDGDLEACNELTDPVSHCECVWAISRQRFLCEWNCKIVHTPDFLECIQQTLTDRGACCGGEFSECVAPCEQAYFDAISPAELGHVIALRDQLLGFYDAEECSPGYTRCEVTESGAAACDASYYIQPSEGAVESARRCLSVGRTATINAADRTRARCRADCEEEDMLRRAICPAYQHGCEQRCLADYEYDARLCRSAFQACVCGGVTEEAYAACVEAYRVCFAAALPTALECLFGCCTAEHRSATNDHAQAECELGNTEAVLDCLMPCCTAWTGCLELCTGQSIHLYESCAEACDAAKVTCDAACTELELCDQPGDCPDCFEPLDITEGQRPMCSSSFGSIFLGCAEPDGEGLCSDGNPCANPTESCLGGAGTDCCSEYGTDYNKEIICCDWYECCVIFHDHRGEGDLEPGEALCPLPFPGPPEVQPCDITGGVFG